MLKATCFSQEKNQCINERAFYWMKFKLILFSFFLIGTQFKADHIYKYIRFMKSKRTSNRFHFRSDDIIIYRQLVRIVSCMRYACHRENIMRSDCECGRTKNKIKLYLYWLFRWKFCDNCSYWRVHVFPWILKVNRIDSNWANFMEHQGKFKKTDSMRCV